MTMKPDPLTKDDKWDEWAKTFEECLSLLLGSTGLPLTCVICHNEEPQPLPAATDKENFIAVAELSGKTFETDLEKAHICLLPL